MDAGRLRARHGMAPQPAVKSRRNIRPQGFEKADHDHSPRMRSLTNCGVRIEPVQQPTAN